MYHFQDFPEICWCDLKEHVHEEIFCTLISFVPLEILSERNTQKNGETTVVFPSRQCSSTPVSFGQ
jgi:hypothetical protein